MHCQLSQCYFKLNLQKGKLNPENLTNLMGSHGQGVGTLEQESGYVLTEPTGTFASGIPPLQEVTHPAAQPESQGSKAWRLCPRANILLLHGM